MRAAARTPIWKFKMAKKWRVVDATWDVRLSKIFKTNEWAMIHDNVVAVNPTKIYSPIKSNNCVRNETVDDIIADLKVNGKFYAAFNKWLENVRKEQLPSK